MDVKKRPLVDGQEMGVAKKRAVASITDSPIPVNGKTDTGREELNADNLETFRKEAIFRRMRHYSRENERAQEKIVKLEKCCQVLEANVAAIGACWEQLVQEVRLLVKPEILPSPIQLFSDSPTLLDLAGDVDSDCPTKYLLDSLHERGRDTQKLIAAFVHLGPTAASPENGELRKECSRLHKEVVTLRAELQAANSRIVQAEGDKDHYHAHLLAAEARADRAKSTSVQAMHTQSAALEQEETTTLVQEEPVKIEESETQLSHMPSPIHFEQSLTDGHRSPSLVEDRQDWKAMYELCHRKNEELSEEMLKLKERCNELDSELASPSSDVLQASPVYEALVQRCQFLKSDAEHHKQKCSELTKQVIELHELQEDYREKLNADFGVRYDEQRTMMLKREHESVRLREQRDALQAEVNEMKSRAADKKSTAQFQVLLQSSTDRIAALELDIKRLKSQLAVDVGREDILKLILDDNMTSLPERFRDTERKLEALQTSLSNLNDTAPDIAQHIRAESEAREALARALSRLEHLESIFGQASALPPDLATIANQLREKDELLRIANLQHEQDQAAANDLFAEIERLSAAWEVLDRQNKTRVLELDAVEVKLQKVSGEKAKADNKYFGAMRQKEVAEAERKAIQRTVEKLQKAVERFGDAEKVYISKLTSQEKELSLAMSRSQTYEDLNVTLERKLNEHHWRHEEIAKQRNEMKRQLTEAHIKVEQYRSDILRLGEESIRIRKETDRHSAKPNAVSTDKVTPREMDLAQEYDKCMKLLRCSTCKQNLRSHVLTKCMHSFCKECIQARIDTRQRKCPACNMGFSQGEFQQLYFQG